METEMVVVEEITLGTRVPVLGHHHPKRHMGTVVISAAHPRLAKFHNLTLEFPDGMRVTWKCNAGEPIRCIVD